MRVTRRHPYVLYVQVVREGGYFHDGWRSADYGEIIFCDGWKVALAEIRSLHKDFSEIDRSGDVNRKMSIRIGQVDAHVFDVLAGSDHG